MLRVALGRARPDTEWGSVSQLEFNVNPALEKMQASTRRTRSQGTNGGFETSTTLTIPRNHLDQWDADLEARDDGGGKGRSGQEAREETGKEIA
jgi:hypothetical protein